MHHESKRVGVLAKVELFSAQSFDKNNATWKRGSTMRESKFKTLNVLSGVTSLIIVVMCILSQALSQSFGDRMILTGVWHGREVEYVERQILVGLQRGVTPADVDVLFEQIDVTVVKDFDRLKIALMETPVDGNLFEIIQLLDQSPLIRYAEPNMVYHETQTHPNDRYYLGIHPQAGYPRQWALNDTGQTPPGGTPDTDIDAPEGWDYETGSSDILVAILDTGIPLIDGALSHKDLDNPNKFILGADYTWETDGTVRDTRGHGTHVTGIVSAETNNDYGVAGVCWNCKILVIQVFDLFGYGDWDYFKEGVYAAVDSGAKIINFSGGGIATQPQLKR